MTNLISVQIFIINLVCFAIRTVVSMGLKPSPLFLKSPIKISNINKNQKLYNRTIINILNKKLIKAAFNVIY